MNSNIIHNKIFIISEIIRIIFYITFFSIFIIIPTKHFEEAKSICMIYRYTGMKCPTCGVTRAFSSLMHLNFKKAFEYHPIFTISFGPICIFIFLQDLWMIIHRHIKKNDSLSILEFTFLKYIA